MAELTTTFDPIRGEAMLKAFGAVTTSSPVAMRGANLREGLEAALGHAELLAAQAGVVPWFDLGGGLKGVIVFGKAREKIDQAPREVRTLYLAVHGAVRIANGFARTAKKTTTRIDQVPGLAAKLGRVVKVYEAMGPGELGQIGPIPWPAVVMTIRVLGVAAMVAGAWYAVRAKEKEVEVQGEQAKAVASTSTLADLARTELMTTGKIDPNIIGGIVDLAKRESSMPWLVPAAIAGGVVLTGAGVAAGAAMAGRRRR